ncbi:MAG: hypothetical protein Q8Q12_21600 [bacterium]|nr:hypothetical protein [bacterium]
MTDIDSLGGFLGGEQAEGYVTMWVVATAVERTDENFHTYIGYDFPESPDGLHVPPEIVPKVGERVAVLVRVRPELTRLGETKVAAEAAWPTAKAQLDYLPTVVNGRKAWRKVTAQPMPEEKKIGK